MGSIAFRAVAQDGIAYAAGNIAAALLRSGPPSNRVHVLTYLDGVLQDDGTNTSTTIIEGGTTTVAYRTTKPFDAVEFKFDAPTGTPDSADVVEFCSDADVPVP